VVTYFNEFDRFPAAWLRALYPDAQVDERSIADVGADELSGHERCHFFAGIGGWEYALELAGWPADWPVWTGSCPCQPFSAAGKGLGEADPRHLWPEFRRLIALCRPPVVFGEQVASKAGRGWLAGVRADLEALGYAFGAADLCAASCGAPHIRQRLYWSAAYTTGERLPESWERRAHPVGVQAHVYREADRLVHAVRRGALPFVCGGHDGLSIADSRGACKALGNAIVPQVAAAFVSAFMEVIHAS